VSVESLAVCLHHSKATGTAKVILLGIANHDGDGGAWPTVATLAKYGNVHPRNVQKALVKLQSLGDIAVEYQEGGLGNVADQDRPNLYRVLVCCPPTCDGTTQHRDSRQARRMGYQGKLPGMPNYPARSAQAVDKAGGGGDSARGGGGELATPRGGGGGRPPPPPPPGHPATPRGGASATRTITRNHPQNPGVTPTVTTGADRSTWPACAECAQPASRCCSVPPAVSGHSYRPPAGWRDDG
jgi:hypothetical protein